MSNLAWMPLDVADYLKDTRHLTTLEHGAYLLLIMRYWDDGGLPDNEALISRYAGLTREQWAESRDVLAAFFDDGWRHKRIDAELARATEIMEKRRASGKQGGTKRQANARQMLSESQHTDIDNNQKEEPNGSSKKRGTRLPENWQPDIQFALSLGLTLSQANDEAQTFREWWPAQPGQKGVKADWDLTWKTWCRRASKRPSSTAPPRETVGSLSRKQLFTPRTEVDVTNYSAGRVDPGGRGRLEEGAGASRTFAITGDVLGRI